VDRSPMLRAMEQQGHTVTSLANAVGVDVPAISRLLRTPKDRQGDPGGRNPSIGTASAIANTLKLNVEALFPDLFSGQSGTDAGPRDQPGNRGSGMKGAAHGSARKGKATQKWTQGGAPSE
jgi:transcriptional regulator with XRE-family HTH domain